MSAPTIGSIALIVLDAAGARVTLSVNLNGVGASVYFEYGLTPDYGFRTPMQNISGSNVPINIEALFPALEPDTTYHFRMVVTSPAGIFFGPDEVFTSLPSDAAPSGP